MSNSCRGGPRPRGHPGSGNRGRGNQRGRGHFRGPRPNQWNAPTQQFYSDAPPYPMPHMQLNPPPRLPGQQFPGPNFAPGILGSYSEPPPCIPPVQPQRPHDGQMRTYIKSPVQMLQGMTNNVQYELLEEKSLQNQNSLFKMLVKVEDKEFIGVGSSKEIAKEKCAEQAMQQLYDMYYTPDESEGKKKKAKNEWQKQKGNDKEVKHGRGPRNSNVKESAEDTDESHDNKVDNILTALKQLTNEGVDMPGIEKILEGNGRLETGPEPVSHKKTRRGKSGRGRGGCHRKKKYQGENDKHKESDEESDDSEDDSDMESVKNEKVNRSMGSGLNIASASKSARSTKKEGRSQKRDHPHQAVQNDSDDEDDSDVHVNEVFKYLVQEFGGMVKFSVFTQKNRLFPDGSDVDHWFKSHRRRFHLFENKGKIEFIAPFYKDATYCLDYAGSGCHKKFCEHFHICQHYLRGFCKQGRKCRKSHNYSDSFNQAHKMKLGLESFNDDEISTILVNRFPQICPKKSCKVGHFCPFLHICLKWKKGQCNEQCSLCHSLDTDHNRWILNQVYHMEKWDRGKSSVLMNIISFPRRRPKGSRTRDSESSKQDEEESLIGDMDNMSLSDSDIEEVVPPPVISRKDRFSSMDSIQDTEYMTSVTPGTGAKPKVRSKKSQEKRESLKRNSLDKSEETIPKSVAKIKVTTDDADSVFICLSNIQSKCRHGDGCRFHHKTYGMPYLWQVKLHDKWRTFSQPDNEDIEQHYCACHEVADSKVGVESVDYKLHVCFKDPLSAVVYEIGDLSVQQTERSPVRRLTTPSYMTRKPYKGNDKVKGTNKDMESTFHTQWRWYFRDDYKQWMLYQKDGLQYTLENKYAVKQKTYLYSRENYKFMYKVIFEKMEQINLDTQKIRPILRRPLFVSSADLRTHTHPKSLMVNIPESIPTNWAPLDVSGAEFELVELDKTSKEYTSVDQAFFLTLSKTKYQVEWICRVQNRSLWNAYTTKKDAISEKWSNDDVELKVDERSLFHGTDSIDTCRKICTNSFDFRISGKNATVYGEGSYFATEAEYSNRYTGKEPHASRLMFQAKVLVGKYAKGQSSYKRPPELSGGSHKLYDSCVNDVRNPSIFIVFDTSQCYPEYLISYRKKEGLTQQQPSAVPTLPARASTAPTHSVQPSATPTHLAQPSATPTFTDQGYPFRGDSSMYGNPYNSAQKQIPAGSQGLVSSSAAGTNPYPEATYRSASGKQVPFIPRVKKNDACCIQ